MAVLASLLLVAIGSAYGSVAAQTAGALTARIEAVDDAGGNGTAVVTVLGVDGRPVVGLEAADFVATDAGVPVEVSSVTRAEDASVGIAVVLAVDTSRSMGPVLDAARTGAGGVIASLGPEDRAAIISFSREVEVVQSLTGDAGELSNGLSALVADGATTLHDAILEAISTAQAAPLDRRVVILLTDGLDEGSAASREEALNAAAEGGVPVYAIGFGEETDEALLSELAAASDGTVLLAPDAPSMLAAYEEFAGVLRSQYVIEFEPSPPTAEASREFTVTVALDGEQTIARRTYTSARPVADQPAPAPAPAVEAAATAVATAAVAPEAVVAPQGSDGIGATPLVGSGVAMLALAAVALIVLRRRQQVVDGPALVDRGSHRVVRVSPTAVARASLHPIDGAAGEGLVVAEGDLLTLDAGSGDETTTLQAAPARLWWRDGKLMFHRRAVLGQSSPTWATLESGDVIEVGSDRFRVEIDPATTESRT